MIAVTPKADGLAFSVYVQPRSSQAAIVGIYQGALKIKLTAPPVNNSANRQCIQILAKALKLPKSAITITSGQTHRLKQILVHPGRGGFTTSEIKALEHKLIRLAQRSS